MKKIFWTLAIVFFIISCDDITEVEDISNQTLTILAPTDQSELTNTNIVFSWDAVIDAEQYRLQIASPTFDSATQIVLDSTIANTNFTQTLNSGNYEWRVRAENFISQTAFTSQSFSVDTKPVDISSELVNLLSPANALVFEPTDTINFFWEGLPEATSYTFQIAQPSFSNAIEIISNVTQNNTSFSISNLPINTYQWRVRASNPDFETAFSTQNFSVE